MLVVGSAQAGRQPASHGPHHAPNAALAHALHHLLHLQEILQQPVHLWRNSLVNQFEESVFARYPLIREAKEEMYRQGAAYASMSGSGASVFGIFSSEVNLRSAFPGMTYWAGFGQD